MLRIGAVNYLNTKPLVFGLDQLAPHAQVVYDLPSRLADRLAEGELDVALIPSFELFSRPDYQVVSDACIGCRGPVLSVKLFSRVPVTAIRSLATDEGSRTSAVLLQILLAEQFDVHPQIVPLPIGSGLNDVTADAALLIGDRAIHSPDGRFETVWDLGDQWYRWTGLPFVFALWAGRSEADLGDLDTALAAARDLGVANLEQIAATEAAPLGLTGPQCLDYLRDNLNFFLGPQQQQGLGRFYQYATRWKLAPPGLTMNLADHRPIG